MFLKEPKKPTPYLKEIHHPIFVIFPNVSGALFLS
jgi:hypothetical protein